MAGDQQGVPEEWKSGKDSDRASALSLDDAETTSAIPASRGRQRGRTAITVTSVPIRTNRRIRPVPATRLPGRAPLLSAGTADDLNTTSLGRWSRSLMAASCAGIRAACPQAYASGRSAAATKNC
jgi:hypothetical protein